MKFLLVLVAVLAPALSDPVPGLTARIPEGYIVGGRDASPGNWPWQASLQYYGSHICGASLISNRWLITAAHCVGRSANTYSVVLGAHDLRTGREGNPTRYSIRRIIINPGWVSSGSLSFPNDIAVMETTATVDTSSDFISAVDLADSGEEFSSNSNCWISGWGNTIGGVSSAPNNLQELQVNVWTPTQCGNQVYRYGPWHVCIRQERASACNGDSGGPLHCNVNGRWKVAGAASFVYGYCSTNAPTIYAQVSYFRDWIRETTGV